MPCSFEHERALAEQGIEFIAGIDEAGRGPLAGPVVAAAVIFREHRSPDGLNDSKKLTAKKREELHDHLVQSETICWAVAIVEAPDIDRINILKATHQAMREAVAQLAVPARHVLIDGLPVPGFPLPQTSLVGGDGISLSVAAASVIAKVTRDRIMKTMDDLYPAYGFARHKGYGTEDHLAALHQHGPCPLHRMSFAPVAQKMLF